MNESSFPHLPTEVHTDRNRTVKPDPLHRVIPPRTEPPPKDNPDPPHRFANLRIGLVCLAMTVGLGAVLIPALRVAYDAMGGSVSSAGVGQALGQGLLQGGFPSANTPLGGVSTGEAQTTANVSTDSGSDEETAAVEPDETADAVTGEAPSGSETDTDGEPVTDLPAHESSSVPSDEPPTEPDPESDSEPTTESETAIPVPDGCYPFASVDMSDTDRGAGYVISDGVDVPQRLPAGRLWSTAGAPTVLVVNTHPYEGYSDGTLWYDPAEGGLAVTATPNAADGTVALSAALTRALRDAGVTVIHLRIAVSAEDTAAEIYDRTETMIRYYCRLYPDIGLVVNLRRSAELTEDGAILRTAGSYGGEPCAQARIAVSGGRGEAALGRDVAVALALREGLWGIDPTLSRPVWVKTGGGLISDLTDVCVLTLETGSAGNTYAEAKRLIDPLAIILGDLILDAE